jgi:hypothetical protein
MTTDTRDEDPDRMLAALIEPLPTLSARLRAAAEDIQFQGRPDPHDDKALLREAATHIETVARDLAKYTGLTELPQTLQALLEDLFSPSEIRRFVTALCGEDTVLSANNDTVFSEAASAVAPFGADLWVKLLAERPRKGFVIANVLNRESCRPKPGDPPLIAGHALTTCKVGPRGECVVMMGDIVHARGRAPEFGPEQAAEEQRQFGQWLVSTFQPGAVDEAAVLCPRGEYESGVQFCRRALQLALERGAFAPGQHIQTEQGPMLLAGESATRIAELESQVSRDDLAMAELAQTIERLVGVDKNGVIEPETLVVRLRQFALVMEDLEAPNEQSAQAIAMVRRLLQEAAVALAAHVGREAVDTRFVSAFYLSDPDRVGLRFEGLPDVQVPDADAHALAKVLLSGGERSAPSWKVISRAAEYFGQRIHVDAAAGKLVLTDSRTYYEAKPGEVDRFGAARAALRQIGASVQGSGGSVTLASVARVGVTCGLTIDEFRPLLHEWNRGCSPPWDLERLEQLLVAAYSKAATTP